jgi:hypothetical protein
MARIFRFNSQAAVHLTMQAAQQAGQPVNIPQVAQGIQALLGKLAEYGIGLMVSDDSPYFQNLIQQYGGNGALNNVRQTAPAPPQAAPQPVYQQPAAQPVYVQPQPQPQPQFQPQARAPQAFPQPNPAPWQQPVVPGAVTPGQPLPELTPPPGGARPMQAGITQLRLTPTQPMPAGLGDNPGLTEGPPAPLTPTILE